MRFIENPDLREWVKESLCRAVFQKAHELAVQTGCEVLVKFQDAADQSGQYYATRTLHLLYKGKGLTKQPWEVQVSGVTGLPETVLVEKGCQSDGWMEDVDSKEDRAVVMEQDVMSQIDSPFRKTADCQMTPVSNSLGIQRVSPMDSDEAENSIEENLEDSYIVVKEEQELDQFTKHCSSSGQLDNLDFGRVGVPSESQRISPPSPDNYQSNDGLSAEEQGSNPVCDPVDDDSDNVARLLPSSATYPIGFPINKLQALAKSVDTRIHTPFPSQILANFEKTTQKPAEVQSTEAVVPALKPYQCGICGKTFGSIQILSRHAQMNHGMDRRMCFLCDVCGQSYKLAQHLQRHMRMHRTVMPYICSVCSKGFFNGTSLIKHEKIHQKFNEKVLIQFNQNAKFHCQICLKFFSQLSELQEHSKQIHGSHVNAPSDGTPSSQNVLHSAITSEDSTVEASSEGHLGEEISDEISVEASQSNNLAPVTSSLPGPGTRPVFPQVIQDPTENKCSLQEEQRQENVGDPQMTWQETNLTCSVVETVSNIPSSSAVNMHSGIRQSFQRNMGLFSVGSQSSNLFRLNRHVCNLCGKSYKYNFTLKEHLLTHASVPQFACKICGTKFTRQRQLRDHMFRHSGTYPYHCEFCGKGFIRPSTMKRHQTDRHRMLHEEL